MLRHPFAARLANTLSVLTLLVLTACEGSSDADPTFPGSTGGHQGGSGQSHQGGPGQTGAGPSGPGAQHPGEHAGADAGLPDDEPGSFESDVPSTGGQTGGRGAGAGGLIAGIAGGGGLAGGAIGGAVNEGGPTTGDAARAIIEADIVQVAGDRLYALSRVAGLSVIDIARPSALRLLGSYRELPGTPFEMYLRDGVAVVMFSSWGQYEKQSDGSFVWVQLSKVVALDVTDATAIARVGDFDVAGEISDSRLVGDVMYVVGYQNGSCFGCQQNRPLTSVLSLDLTNPRALRRVDALELSNSTNLWGAKPSISVSAERIYIAGPEYGSAQPTGSTIQVIDISDPSGDLAQGARVSVAGQITNRWQIDEYQGVLRVVSQPWQWPTTPPSIQTYRVASSQSITPLGSADIQMPPNEQLMSVRFDGPRGYAITAERTDPLFTLDLSDPAQPRQVGELKMPGWVYHLEPRGERLIGLGYDQRNPAGAVTVSLFDVSNLANPRMLSRVNFGGTWAQLPEDQDRIHKSFKILDQLGLILVPFTGTSSSAKPECSGVSRSGVQLVDFAGDALTARGLAPLRGEARRALVHGSSLLAVGDEAVAAYDLSDRAAPAAQGQLIIARNVSRALPLSNGHVARINQDWYAERSSVDIVALADVERADRSAGEVDLGQALQGTEPCAYGAWIRDAHTTGTQITVSYERYTYGADDAYASYSGMLVIDAANPARPSVLSKLEWSLGQESFQWGAFSEPYDPKFGYTGSQLSAVRTERALVALEQRYTSWTLPGKLPYELRLRVVDLSDPRAPSETTLELPFDDGHSGLVLDGEDVLISHYELDDSNQRARFYIDRVELSDPKQPRLTDKINVPGMLMHLDREHGRAVTSELVRTTVDLTGDECFARFVYADFTPSSGVWSSDLVGVCTGFTQRLNLVRFVTGGAVLEDTHQLGDRDHISSSSLADGRVVAVLSKDFSWPFYGASLSDCWGRCGFSYPKQARPTQLLVLGGLSAGDFEIGQLTVDDGDAAWWGFYGSPPVYAFGARAVLLSQQDAVVIDIGVASAPKLLRAVPLYGYAQSVDGGGSLALLALGMNGVQRVDL